MMHIWGVLGDPKNASKIPPCRGDSLLEREWVLERSRDGVREGPERNGGPMMHGPRGSAPSAPPVVELKVLGWTGSALDHGGVAGFKGCATAADPGIIFRGRETGLAGRRLRSQATKTGGADTP